MSKPREVRFEDKGSRGPRGGTPRLSATTDTASCHCDDIDVDMTYRMCCLTVDNSPSYKAATLFDTGAHASFVNREVAAWVEGQARRNPGYLQKTREGQDQRCTTVSLAGTAYNSPILGCVVFDLTFFNEVSRLHETIRNIRAQVIDSCIPVIVSRPII